MGVMLRTILLVNGMALVVALAQESAWADIVPRMVEISTLLQPVLLTSLLLLFVLNSQLSRLIYWQGVIAVMLLAGGGTLAIYLLGGELYAPPEGGYFPAVRNVLLAFAAVALLLAYFRLRALALSPALQASRLQALQARIRPHFLFNSINAVLGIVRADPKRAETALEDMSDLFRMAMAYRGDLVPARQEVALAQQYLALEQLRLGERLKVSWHTEDLPEDALMPPLILQPLLENAVYHGIEPMAEGGLIGQTVSARQ
jgi:two-component system sensor histidine kinase AlgZ